METTTLRMTEELAEYITRIAKKKGITRNALIVQILWDWKKKIIREEDIW